MTALLRVLAFSLLAFPLAAAPLFGPNDVVVAGQTGGVGSLKVFDATGNFRTQLLDRAHGEVRFAPDGLLGVLHGDEVLLIASDGSVARRIAMPRGHGIGSPRWLTFGRDGSFLVADGGQILDFSATGVPGGTTFYTDGPVVGVAFISGIDLSPNPCTLFASELHITTIKLCSSGYVPSSILPVVGRGIRLLPDGTFLTSVGVGPYRLTRYRPDGSLVRTYTPTGRVLAIDADPRFAWLEIQAGVAQKLDLGSDALVGTAIVTGFTEIRGLAPVGEWRAAIDGPQPIPTLSEWVLIALAVILGAIALRRLA